MLTSIYYYEYYRPYILSNQKWMPSYDSRNLSIVDDREPRNYLLNKALKTNVVEYAKNFSDRLNSLQTAIYRANYSGSNRAGRMEELYAAISSLDEFASSQSHSPELLAFSKELSAMIEKPELYAVDSIHMVMKMDEKLKEFLKTPLSEHMNFRNLGYYYNYKYGSIRENTFSLIESGMLYYRAI